MDSGEDSSLEQVPVYRRSPQATWRSLRTGVVVAVPGQPHPLHLNDTGAAIWDLLQEPIELSALTGRLVEIYGRMETEVMLGAAQLLDELMASGAVIRE